MLRALTVWNVIMAVWLRACERWQRFNWIPCKVHSDRASVRSHPPWPQYDRHMQFHFHSSYKGSNAIHLKIMWFPYFFDFFPFFCIVKYHNFIIVEFKTIFSQKIEHFIFVFVTPYIFSARSYCLDSFFFRDVPVAAAQVSSEAASAVFKASFVDGIPYHAPCVLL